jgi:hypothetical protein
MTHMRKSSKSSSSTLTALAPRELTQVTGGSGKRQHEPVSVAKEWGPASPQG